MTTSQRLVTLSLNLLKWGFATLAIDLVLILVWHEGYDVLGYFVVSFLTTLIFIAITTVQTYSKMEDKFYGKLIYSFLALILSSLLFIYISLLVGNTSRYL